MQGLSTNVNQLRLLLNSEKPVAAILSETHVTDDINDNEIMVKGYNILLCNSHSRHTDGVIFYVKKNVMFKVIKVVILTRSYGFLVSN